MQTPFARRLENETLDGLATDDPAAIASRRDLRRINRVMGAAGIIGAALAASGRVPRRIIELGCGDGSLMLRLAQRFAGEWQNVHLTLLDRQDVVSEHTREAFSRLGWTTEILCADVMRWAAQRSVRRWDFGVANLFIHHFDEQQIALLFAALGARTDLFVACEPRRGYFPLLASRMVGLLGANAVTRQDAVLSVRAGFCREELSALWPRGRADWRLAEASAGLASHRFVAVRRTA